MKNIFILITLFVVSLAQAQTPRAGGINNSQATVLNVVHDNFVGVQSTNMNALAVYNFNTNFTHYLGLKTTDDLVEGSGNKYFSNTLARAAFSNGTGLDYSAGVYSLNSATQGTLASVAGKFNTPTGTSGQYLDGTGTPVTFPNLSLYYLASNPNGYISSVPAQTWLSITGKPTTLSGYGITDAYPLTGNPSNFLTSFTETDPTVPAYAKGLTNFNQIKTSTDVLYEPIFSKNTAFNKNFGTSSGTVAEGNDSRINNGQTAFGWGNHASAGYLLASTAASTYATIVALSGKFNNPTGTTSQYIRGDGSLATFPTIPTNTNQLTNGAGFMVPSDLILTTTGTSGAATYNSGTKTINVPNYSYTAPSRIFTVPTFASATTATQLSTTRDSDVSYSFDGSVAITLLGGQGITVTLTYADNAAMTTNPVIVDSNGFASSGLAGLSQTQTITVKGYIPAGKYRRVTFTLSQTGTATLPTAPSIIKAGQEVQL